MGPALMDSAPTRGKARAVAVLGAAGVVVLGLTAGLAPHPAGAQPAGARSDDPRRAGGLDHARGTSAALSGRVQLAGDPVDGAQVLLVRAGDRPAQARRVARVRADAEGRFAIVVPDDVGGQLYLTAAGGRLHGQRVPASVVLATAIGGTRTGDVTVNEATTVAAGFSLAQLAEDGELGGAEPGLSNAMRMTRNLVDPRTGRTTAFLREAPNGTSTQTWPTFNALASIITGCATRTNDCRAFLRAAGDAWGHRPRSTFEAMTTIPKNPAGAPARVFAQVPDRPAYRPVLRTAPSSWVLALQFVGNGHEFNGPGNVAFDEHGAVWIINNAQWAIRLKDVCPGIGLFKLDPFAPGRPVRQFFGGGINGAGFGMGFDPDGHLWTGNFGFSGKLCPIEPTSNSVSEFLPSGRPVSPPEGYRKGPISWPQGTVSDRDGTIWIASCGNSTVVRYPHGDPRRSQVVGTGVGRAFDVAVNTEGNVFATANQGEKVFGFDPRGKPLPGSPYGDSSVFSLPLGIASDRLGNTWVSNSAAIPSPCKSGQDLEPVAGTHDPSIVKVGPDGSLRTFTGGGLTIPWGIAVDGDDNIWVANFGRQRVSHFCGARHSTCPTGRTGDPISPPQGYAFDGLQRNTGVEIDPSGNVWLTNNWKKIPVQVNPFGRGLVAYLGMAPPVAAPLIGPPRVPR